ncbi:MAG: hypothetical protein IPF52_17515 [Saprospiraceae bacterium]|nr:hypothetical protein [Saprospiraceae bacterium]
MDKVWVTQGMKPGVVACSHHLGRWRREQDQGNRWATNTVKIVQSGDGKWKMNTKSGINHLKVPNPDNTVRIFWADGGVHQNVLPTRYTRIPSVACIAGTNAFG